MLRKLIVILLITFHLVDSAPKNLYDQRQDGNLNVKLDLDNFVILVARPSNPFDLLGTISDLYSDRSNDKQTDSKEFEFESKSLAGDDDKDIKSDLEDVTLDKQDKQGEDKKTDDALKKADDKQLNVKDGEGRMEVVIVESSDKATKDLGEIIRTLRNLNEKDDQPRAIVGKYKFVESVAEPQNLKLIGDAIENCGPGRSRDRKGICQGDRIAEE